MFHMILGSLTTALVLTGAPLQLGPAPARAETPVGEGRSLEEHVAPSQPAEPLDEGIRLEKRKALLKTFLCNPSIHIRPDGKAFACGRNVLLPPHERRL